MKVNTTASAGDGRAMSEGSIDRAFRQVAGTLDRYPKKSVRLPLSGDGGEVKELGYNGRMFLIRRGQQVELPIPLVEILEQAGLIGG